MEEPICFSQHFANKQNVRSFSNFMKIKILKSENTDYFVRHLQAESESLIKLPNEFIKILIIIKTNLINTSRQDFKNFFSCLCDDGSSKLSSVDKGAVFSKTLEILHQIIPKQFYGGNHNSKIWQCLMKLIIFSMKGEHFLLSNHLSKWKFDVYPWNTMSSSNSENMLKICVVWLVRYVITPILCLSFYITTCKLDTDEYKLHFFWKHRWQSFYDKAIVKLINRKVIKQYEPLCLGKSKRSKYSNQERVLMKEKYKDIPNIYLVLKPNNDARPIVRYKNECLTVSQKYKMKEKLNFLKTLIGNAEKRINLQYSELYKNWISANKPTLYFIKSDLSNAFGMVDRQKLQKILTERYINIQKMETNLEIKKKFAIQYKEVIQELRKQFLVKAGSTVYEWKQGLIQGCKYSPALSELYHKNMDEKYFNQLIDQKRLRLFSRVVDDYLYITNSIEDAHLFLDNISKYPNVNYSKTEVNFDYPNVKFSENINFIGYSFNTNTLQVLRSDRLNCFDMQYKIAFTRAIYDVSSFLSNRIGQTGNQINSLVFNFYHNDEEVVWNQIFATYCLSASKFCAIISKLCSKKEMNDLLLVYKKKVTVNLTNTILRTLVINKPKEFTFIYCINNFRYMSWKALYMCAVKSKYCNTIIPLVKIELLKCDCAFGKWRIHASRVDQKGLMTNEATREVCKRNDFKVIMKSIDVLLKGF